MGAPYRRKLSVHVVPGTGCDGNGTTIGADETDGEEEDGEKGKTEGPSKGNDSTPDGNDSIDDHADLPQVRCDLMRLKRLTQGVFLSHVH